MSVLFINGSPNENGNTAELAETLMNGKAYQTLNLVVEAAAEPPCLPKSRGLAKAVL